MRKFINSYVGGWFLAALFGVLCLLLAVVGEICIGLSMSVIAVFAIILAAVSGIVSIMVLGCCVSDDWAKE